MAKAVEIELSLEIPDEDVGNIFFEEVLKDLFEDLLYDYSEMVLLDFAVKGVYD